MSEVLGTSPVERQGLEPLLLLEGVTKSYDGWSKALDDVSLSVARGEFVSIIGCSGAGKSTLLRCVNRLIDPTQGSVVFDGDDVTHVRGRALRQTRRRIAMVFQHYNLVYRATAIENVLLAAWAKGIGSCWLSAPQRMGFGPAFQRRFAPDKGEFVAAVTLGYPDQQPKMPPRRDGRYLIV